jgi:hypothetical protein
MKTINIKGKEYVTVNERLKEFRNTFKDYSLVSEIIELGADFCTMKATIIDDKGVVRATGFAREVIAKSPINKFAFVENCETSAMGRALGNFGIGIDDAVCTADELLMKLSQESKPEKTDFEKDASKAATQATKAMNKAVAAQDETLVKPAQYKGTLSERYNKAKEFLDGQTPQTFKSTKATVIDSLNALEKDLDKAGSAGWLDYIKTKRAELTGAETGNFY